MEFYCYQKQWLEEILMKMDACREYHPVWGNLVTKEQTEHAVTDNGMLTPESPEHPKTSHRLCEDQEKREKKRIYFN